MVDDLHGGILNLEKKKKERKLNSAWYFNPFPTMSFLKEPRRHCKKGVVVRLDAPAMHGKRQYFCSRSLQSACSHPS